MIAGEHSGNQEPLADRVGFDHKSYGIVIPIRSGTCAPPVRDLLRDERLDFIRRLEIGEGEFQRSFHQHLSFGYGAAQFPLFN